MRPVEDRQAVRLLFEITPVRVGLGNVSAEEQTLSFFADDERKVSSEGSVVGIRDENGKGIGSHEGESISVIARSKVFGDVHVFFVSLGRLKS